MKKNLLLPLVVLMVIMALFVLAMVKSPPVPKEVEEHSSLPAAGITVNI